MFKILTGLNSHLVRQRWREASFMDVSRLENRRHAAPADRILLVVVGRSSDKNHNDVQIGFPVLPEIASPIYFDLLRAWLRRCDDSHRCNRLGAGSERTLPSRLLYVGNSDPNILALHNTTTRIGIEGYIALSHCWGDLPAEVKDQFCSSTKNIGSRQEGFSIEDLPRTFQDAIRVTRELGQQYLWIDSLCILQDDKGDWERESKLMEGVFSSAYCVIAASSAVNSEAGFLKRDVSSRYVPIVGATGIQLYICEDMDDFEMDVDKALLNTRGWVLQERVLSRRTIHFSANHTYWECGEGVCCENLNRLKSPQWKQYFVLDPIFPKRLLEAGTERIVDFLNSLFEGYSMRGLTQPTDRVTAVFGLQSRIESTLGCEGRYGVLKVFLHRNLLWQRHGTEKMERIAYNNLKAPSWSWMSYRGGIKFVDVSFATLDDIRWLIELKFDGERNYALTGSLGKFWKCTIIRGETRYVVLDYKETERGWLQFDVEDSTDLDLQKCVVVGRTGRGPEIKYFILVVRPTAKNGEYERVGVGLVQESHVSKLEGAIRIV
ncbi:hypothetical protein IFR05_007793 [Cadophora sp. M221]|nr:hypothetical protein IFR05_007793 [Cadophora sp. M221]